ncbi:MAG: tryptophan halogenase family protein [Gammaproteobacteria bacterium]
MHDNSEFKIVIVGGGTAGWMTAAAIATALPRSLVTVELVESEAIGIIGVGEATLPHLRQFNENLGLDETRFMASTHASFKLGIEFVDWGRIGDRYIHPFGDYGTPLGGVAFHHYWRKATETANVGAIGEYSLPIMAAYAARFQRPVGAPDKLESSFGYAYHMDSARYGQVLREHAERRGVRRTEGRVTDVERERETGDIRGVKLDDGTAVRGDFFVDCTGFRGVLIEDALSAGYDHWSSILPCDRAVAVQCEDPGPLLPYTRATADQSGWRWRIPLQHRLGNGYVYCSDFISDDEATARLLDTLEGDALTEPKPLRFTTGKRRKMWHHNCLAVGLSGGFLEPLESTSIYLIQAAITRFIELFPVSSDYAVERDEYNRILDNEFDRVRDFLVLHYHASTRDDSPFWRAIAQTPTPDSLQEKMDLFRSHGRIAEYQQGLFLAPSWLAVYLGQGIVPDGHDPRLDHLCNDELQEKLQRLRERIGTRSDAMPDHAHYLNSDAAGATP